MTKKKIKLYFEFYISTLLLNFFLTLLSFIFFNDISLSLVVFCTFGYISSILYIENFRKNEYYFYYNSNISKYKLVIFSFFLNILITFLFIIFLNVSHFICR